jgi:hypothetical protein
MFEFQNSHLLRLLHLMLPQQAVDASRMEQMCHFNQALSCSSKVIKRHLISSCKLRLVPWKQSLEQQIIPSHRRLMSSS